MAKSPWFGRSLAAGMAAALALAIAATPAAARDGPRAVDRAKARAETALHRAVSAGGPFFTAAERAAVEQACGYPAGSWDGFEVTIRSGIIRCSNGRAADTPEARAAAAAAMPRIALRIRAALARPEIRDAIGEYVRLAQAEERRENMRSQSMFAEAWPYGLTRPPGR